SDMFELKAIEMIAQNLKAAVDNGKDVVAREAMSQAQYIAGMGFSNVGLGIVHSMAHPLGAFYDTPHGVANALLLPYVMEYNAESPAAPKYINIAKAMGVETAGMSEAEGVKVITGVNIGDFGQTTHERFIDLVKAMDQVEGIKRYRISSLEPDLCDDDLIEYCAQSRAFMPHFHIPLQSGSDEVSVWTRRMPGNW
ncbi:lactaldehyde reductase, partial [human gut metagenome]